MLRFLVRYHCGQSARLIEKLSILLWRGSSEPRANPRDKFLHARKYASHNFIHASRVGMEPV